MLLATKDIIKLQCNAGSGSDAGVAKLTYEVTERYCWRSFVVAYKFNRIATNATIYLRRTRFGLLSEIFW